MNEAQPLLSCVTDGVLRRVTGRADQAEAGDIVLAGGMPARIGRRGSFSIIVRQEYHLIERTDDARDRRWLLQVDTYSYRLLDATRQEIVAWHWHPKEPNVVKHPHLHLGPAARIGLDALHRAHLPTGVVTIADIVRCAITEFGVEPRRDDWRAILGAD
jgi:hypothetical protein